MDRLETQTLQKSIRSSEHLHSSMDRLETYIFIFLQNVDKRFTFQYG